MDKKAISISHKMKDDVLDDDFTLHDEVTVIHEYNNNTYPGVR